MFPSWKNSWWICLLYTQFTFSQSLLETQSQHAEFLFHQKEYYDAITEYKRLQFFDVEKKYAYEADFKIGLSYKAGAWFDEAIRYFSQAGQYTVDEEKLYQSGIEIIKTNILRRTIPRALRLCDEMENDQKYFHHKPEIIYWRGWAYMFADDWESAYNCFSQIRNDDLASLCSKVINEKVSVTFAKVISYFLPGAGQVYSGEVLSGLMSLAWNIFAGYLTVNAFAEQRAFDAIVTGDLLWLRFYHGNVQNAERFAIDKNLRVANQALMYLQNEYKGLKP